MQKKAVIGGVAAAAVVGGLGSWWAVGNAVESQASERGTCSATLGATAAAGTTVLVAAPASADVERRGTCAGATYD